MSATNGARVTLDGPYPPAKLVTIAASPSQVRPRRPCHYRAIHSSPDRSSADTHGQHHSGLDLCHPLLAEVTTQADLALQAGGRGFESHHLHNRRSTLQALKRQPPPAHRQGPDGEHGARPHPNSRCDDRRAKLRPVFLSGGTDTIEGPPRLVGLLRLVEERVPGARANRAARWRQATPLLEGNDGVPGLWAEVTVHR